MGNATIKDIATLCGVSVATVSLILNGRDGRISDETRQRVLTKVMELNYTPNQNAVRLRTKRGNVVGLIIASMLNPHIAKVFMGIDEVVRSHGYSLNCCTAESDGNVSIVRVRKMLSSGVEGVILASPSMEDGGESSQELLHLLQSSGLPVVARDNEVVYQNKIGSNITVNYEIGGYMATKHLLEMGHRHIGCVSGIEKMKVTTARLDGYYRALREFGVEPDDKLIYKGNYELESGSVALPYLLGKNVTAVFAFNDNMAYGLYRSARSFGVQIPTELSVVGFDNIEFDDILEVPLTSVDIQTEKLGVQLADELLRLINEPDTEHKNIIFEPNLMVRGSVARI